MALTPKQQMFVKEYLIDLNATQAAIRAGYSDKTANEQGSRLLANVKVSAAIQKAMDKRASKVAITAENVLESILDIRDTCATKMDLIDKEGNVKAETLVDVNGAIKANELLGKHLKLFTDKVELEVTKMPDIKIIK